ncbi:MAG: hypothetical protein C5B50_29035 [Verrucomicrobia bacterium]|nr:MAG: hypothetical protein C5B50_29035 [Verrucomicrobiota bacterium]
MAQDATHIPKVGAFVLETLTTGMYTNALDALREYVQNSFDSIQNASRTKALPRGAGRIDITIDDKKKELKIRDNGLGIPAVDVLPRLINIGMSAKTIADSAGFRGIGRLAGIAYCQRLIFRTRAHGEREIHEVTFRCDDIRKSMSPAKLQTEEVADVLLQYTESKSQKTNHSDAFFEVTMHGIVSEEQIFLDWQRIEGYLAQVAPVKFDTNSFPRTGDIYSWLRGRSILLPEISLVIHAGAVRQEVFKPYRKLSYKTKQQNLPINVKGIRFYPENATPESPFWLWYADTNLPGMFGDDSVGGFRLRKNNIALGMDERMAEIFAEVSDSSARFNSYFIGEIHVQHSGTIPNARRDGFEDNTAWTGIRQELVTFARERSKEIRECSKDRNMAVEKVLRPVEKQIEEADRKRVIGFASKDERESFGLALDKSLDRLKRAKSGERSSEEASRLEDARKRLVQTRETLDTVPFIAQKLNTSLDRKQRRIIAEILELLHQVLDSDSFERARNAISSKYSLKAESPKESANKR